MIIVHEWISKISAMTFRFYIETWLKLTAYHYPQSLFLFEPNRAKEEGIWSGQGFYIEEHLRYDHYI